MKFIWLVVKVQAIYLCGVFAARRRCGQQQHENCLVSFHDAKYLELCRRRDSNTQPHARIQFTNLFVWKKPDMRSSDWATATWITPGRSRDVYKRQVGGLFHDIFSLYNRVWIHTMGNAVSGYFPGLDQIRSWYFRNVLIRYFNRPIFFLRVFYIYRFILSSMPRYFNMRTRIFPQQLCHAANENTGCVRLRTVSACRVKRKKECRKNALRLLSEHPVYTCPRHLSRIGRMYPPDTGQMSRGPGAHGCQEA